MDALHVDGGVPLTGTIIAEGSKNAALPILAACLAIDGTTRLTRVPRLGDVATLRRLLQLCGAEIIEAQAGALSIRVDESCCTTAPQELVRRMRASVCVLGPLLARFGTARVPLPGGCQIGHRPIDIHLRGLAALGADFRLEAGDVVATARQLRGAHISLAGIHGSTVTGTCNVMTAAALAQGRSVLTSAAREPEVVELGRFLNAAGAKISGLGSSVIEIEGVESLHSVSHELPSDRIEVATLAIAAVITRGDVTIANAPVREMTAVLAALDELGATVSTDEHGLRCRVTGALRPIRLKAEPYPGLPTDVQAPFTSLFATIPGESIITDMVFPDRFMHVAELSRMGADIRVSGNTLNVRGQQSLSGAAVHATELRGGAALVLAGLAAAGETDVSNIEHIDRGYCSIESTLSQLGARIARQSAPAGSVRIPVPHIAIDATGESEESVEMRLVEQRR